MSLLPEGYFPGPPDLAVEVLSPSDTKREVSDKVADWLAGGCLVVLVLDPRTRTARLHRQGFDPQLIEAEDAAVVRDLLPGWSLDLAAVFR